MRKVGRPSEGVNGMRVRDYPQVSFRVAPRALYLFAKRVKPLSVSRALLQHIERVGGAK